MKLSRTRDRHKIAARAIVGGERGVPRSLGVWNVIGLTVAALWGLFGAWLAGNTAPSSDSSTSAAKSSRRSANVPSSAEVPTPSLRVAIRATSCGLGITAAAASSRPSSVIASVIVSQPGRREEDRVREVVGQERARLVVLPEPAVAARNRLELPDRRTAETVRNLDFRSPIEQVSRPRLGIAAVEYK